MIRRLIFLIATVIGLGESLVADDYYNYGNWYVDEHSAYGVTGFIDKNGRLGKKGNSYIFFTNGGKNYIYRVDTDGNPNMHPNNPDATGQIATRTFTFISSHYGVHGGNGYGEFYVDDTGIYYGANNGVYRWDFDWSNETTVVSKGYHFAETFARNKTTGEWWCADGGRDVFKWSKESDSWEKQFTHKDLGGSHHDGMEIVNNTIFVSDMTSAYIATYKLNEDGDVINKTKPDRVYEYTSSTSVEGMGYGANQHLWISHGTITEIGGGVLQEELAVCTQEFISGTKWQMLSSKCDINESIEFKDTTIMKMVDDGLEVITDDEPIANYYRSLGYKVGNTLELNRGEGFWVVSREDNITHEFIGNESTVAIELKKNTTRFIGLPHTKEIDLDSLFRDKGVVEIRHFDTPTNSWKSWQGDHSNTDISSIVDGRGFYICVSKDLNLSLSNISPVMESIEDINSTLGQSITLDASKSFDKDGEIVEYIWSEDSKVLSTQKIDH